MHSFSQYFGIHSVQINFRILYSLRTYKTYTMGRLEMQFSMAYLNSFSSNLL